MFYADSDLCLYIYIHTLNFQGIQNEVLSLKALMQRSFGQRPKNKRLDVFKSFCCLTATKVRAVTNDTAHRPVVIKTLLCGWHKDAQSLLFKLFNKIVLDSYADGDGISRNMSNSSWCLHPKKNVRSGNGANMLTCWPRNSRSFHAVGGPFHAHSR